jgi:hypothetical protein
MSIDRAMTYDELIALRTAYAEHQKVVDVIDELVGRRLTEVLAARDLGLPYRAHVYSASPIDKFAPQDLD